MKIVSTCKRTSENLEDFIKLSKELNFEYIEIFPKNQGFTSNQMMDNLEDSTICIVGDDIIDKKVIDSAKQLKYIIKWGAGIDQIDVEYANTKNITVSNTPNILGKYVAEFVLGLIVSSLRKITQNHINMKSGLWDKTIGESLYSKTVGFFGYGNIAKNVTKLIEPFDCKILYTDIKNQNIKNAKYLNFDSLIKMSEIIIIAAPLTVDTQGVFNEESLKNADNLQLLINVSRGELVNESDIFNMLGTNKIKLLALDVFEKEPPVLDQKILHDKNILFTSHNASNTIKANDDVNNVIIKKIRDYIKEIQ
jgi:phosphoglycerate dehydrogenase-like enzyme|tara:strand:- start:271 stop:1194 length:924 start_codon:yes stop_codon:yes gene_type:complete